MNVYPLDDVVVISRSSPEPLLSILHVTSQTPDDVYDAPIVVDVPGRLRLEFTIEQIDALCDLVKLAKSDVLRSRARIH